MPLISLSWVWHKAIYQEPRPCEWWRRGKAVQHKHKNTQDQKTSSHKRHKVAKNAKDNTSKCWRHSRAIHNKHTVQSMARVRNYPDTTILNLHFDQSHGVNHEINLRGQTCDRPYGHCGLSWVWVWSWVRPYNTLLRLSWCDSDGWRYHSIQLIMSKGQSQVIWQCQWNLITDGS